MNPLKFRPGMLKTSDRTSTKSMSFFDQVTESALANGKLREAAKANTLENFRYVFNSMLENLFVDRMDGNEEILIQLMNDDKFKQVAAEHLVTRVYERFNVGEGDK